jgi:hypothetical protein
MKYKSYEDWSEAFTAARKQIGEVEKVLGLWKANIHGNWERECWEEKWGYRKTSKPGAENSGEKKYERHLLGADGTLKDWILRHDDCSYDLKTVYHNFPLSNQQKGQVIADVLAVLDSVGLARPVLVEVKKRHGGPWHALVECLKQVSLARKNSKPICDLLQKKLNSPRSGAWGLVIAPPEFWKNEQRELDKCEDLLKALKTKTRARIAFASLDESKEQIQELVWVKGNWN